MQLCVFVNNAGFGWGKSMLCLIIKNVAQSVYLTFYGCH